MSIKQNGGVFGRNPTFNDVTIEGDLIINGEVFTGLDFQGSWNASTNTPALASSTGTNGEFYIVSVAGSTDLNGITNWGIGDWAIFNGTAWQRVEGGADGNFDALTANSLTVNGTATMDGLTVDGNVTFNTNTLKISDNIPKLVFEDTDTSTLASIIANSSNITYDTVATSKDHIFKQGGTTRMVIDDTGIDVTGTATMDGGISVKGFGTQSDSNSAQGFQLGGTETSSTHIGNIKNVGGKLAVESAVNRSLTLRSYATGSSTYETIVCDTAHNVSIPNGDLSVGGGNITTPQDGAIQMATVTSASGDLWTGINTGANPYASMPSELSIMNTADNTTNSFAGVFFQAGENSAGAGINSARIGAIRTGSINTDLAFATRGAGGMVEAMRIDSSGNLLVGQSAIDTNTVGHILLPNGSAYHIRNGGTAGIFNRKTSDGQIVGFQKDGAQVGSIGTISGDLSIGTGNSGLRFNDPHSEFLPHNMSTNSGTDGTIVLGSGGVRFKDLYLSGGVYLGGTGTANKLDDYEEGTWTPVLAAVSGTQPTISQSNVGYYTKVGRLVTLTGVCIVNSISGTTSGLLQMSGIPFTISSGIGYHTTGAVVPSQLTFARPDNANLSNHDTVKFGFLTSNNGSGWGWEDMSILQAGSQFRFSLSYYTAQ